MPLVGSWTDPRTGSVSSSAYVVASILFDSDAQTAPITVRVYADASAAAGKEPLFQRTITPTGAQINAISAAMMTRVYTALQARSEFAGFSTVP